jgi:transposase
MDLVALLALLDGAVLATPALTPTPPRPCLPFLQPPWGPDHPQFLFEDSRLQPDHLARRIDRLVDVLDLSSLERSYHGTGSLPYPPRLLLKLVLFETHSKVHEPTRWAEHARDFGPLRWLLRGLLPSRSRLYAFRQRLHAWLRPLNRDVIQAAVQHHLTPARAGAQDGTFLAANASRHTLVNEPTLQRRLEQLQQAVAQDLAPRLPNPGAPPAQAQPQDGPLPPPAAAPQDARVGPSSGPAVEALASPRPTPAPAGPPRRLWPLPVLSPESSRVPRLPPTDAPRAADFGTPPLASEQTQAVPSPAVATAGAEPKPARPCWMATTVSGRKEQLQRLQTVSKRLQERLRQNEERRKEDRLPREKVVISLSDSSAGLGRDKLKVFRALYNLQYVTDLDTPLILGYGVYVQTCDAHVFKPMLGETAYFVGRQVPTRLADAGYATGPNLAEAEKAQVTLWAPWQANDVSKEAKKRKQIPKNEFKWSEEEQTYTCPEGNRLERLRSVKVRRKGTETETAVVEYRCPPELCQKCPRLAECARNPGRGRTICRSEHEDKIEALRQRMASPEGKALYPKRKATVERSFADGKEHRGLRRLSARGPHGAAIQAGLVVLVHNLLTIDHILRDNIAKANNANPDTDTT